MPLSLSDENINPHDTPPRLRKVWADGNEEKIVQLDDNNGNMETNTSGEVESKVGLFDYLAAVERLATDTTVTEKGTVTADSSRAAVYDSEDEASLKYPAEAKTSHRNIPQLQEIIDSVVSTNISRVTPPSSRPNTPPNRNSLTRTSSRLHLGQFGQSFTSVQNVSSNPLEKWTNLSSRRSNRRSDVRPWGPRHLEYDYNEARKEFQSAAYYALGQFGYLPPSRTALATGKAIVNPSSLPSMNDLRRIALFRSACEKLDATDASLEDAIARGETWDNTPVPTEYRSLETSNPEDIRSVRLEEPERSRSALTFEEEATLITSPTFPIPPFESMDGEDTSSSIRYSFDTPSDRHPLVQYKQQLDLSVCSSLPSFDEHSRNEAGVGETASKILDRSSSGGQVPRTTDYDQSHEPMSGRSTPSWTQTRSSTPRGGSLNKPRKRGRPQKVKTDTC